MDIFKHTDGFYTGRALLRRGLIVCYNCGELWPKDNAKFKEAECTCGEDLMFIREAYAKDVAIKSFSIKDIINDKNGKADPISRAVGEVG